MLLFKVISWAASGGWPAAALAALAATLLWLTGERRRHRPPPGPLGLPFLGYLPFMKPDAHLHFATLARRYGPIFRLRLGSQSVVVLSDYKLIREAFRREDFTGRPVTEFHNILGGYGIINSEGRLWKDQRKFLHDRLRKFGMTYAGNSKQQMEERIMKEVQCFLEKLARQSRAGEERTAGVDLSPALSTSISNVICSLMMSVRFHEEEPRFVRFMSLIEEGFRLFGSLSYANFVPIMRYLPGLQHVLKKLSKNRSEMAAFFQESVDKHRETFDSNHMRDLVDNYLGEIEVAKARGYEGELFNGMDHDRQIQQVIGDLFSAGMETIKTTLEWSMVYMLHEPEVARRVQEELDSVVGRSRLPSLADRSFLPYTEATILEVLRISSIVPLGTTHAVTRDVLLAGYLLPKNTQIVPLLHAIHMDENLWDNPTKFKPERFLNHEGKIVKPEYFLPFGVGRRMCLGDVLARMELFAFFASLLHTFNIELPEGHSLPSLRATAGVTLTPDRFKITLRPRVLIDSPHPFLNAPSSGLRPHGAH